MDDLKGDVEAMNTTNVVEIETLRKKQELKKTEMNFKNYLSSLKQDQLQVEATYLLNKMTDNLSEEFLLKSALLMDELAKRVSAESMSNTINSFANNIREKIEESDLLH